MSCDKCSQVFPIFSTSASVYYIEHEQTNKKWERPGNKAKSEVCYCQAKSKQGLSLIYTSLVPEGEGYVCACMDYREA